MEAFHAWAEAQLTRIPGKSDLANAFRDGLSRWSSFTPFLDDGRVAIDDNDDDLTYGNIVSVQIGDADYITALTEDGIEELRDMLEFARVSIKEWHSFLDDVVGEPDIIARVKNQPLG